MDFTLKSIANSSMKVFLVFYDVALLKKLSLSFKNLIKSSM